jgi:hypothetical protein
VGAEPGRRGYPSVGAYRSAASTGAVDSTLRHDVDAARATSTHGFAYSDTATTAVLVDAYPLWLEAVERVLQSLGVSVAGKVTSPADAIELLEWVQPALLVTRSGLREER